MSPRLFLFAVAMQVSCATTSSAQTHGKSYSCDEINSEANRVYALARQPAGIVEVLSYVIAPPAGLAMHSERREAESTAANTLHNILELAQLRSCQISIRDPRFRAREQLPSHLVGSRSLECIKSNGVRVHTTYRVGSPHSRAEVRGGPSGLDRIS